MDEFRDLGLEHCLNRTWQDALCYFGENKEVRIGRQYGRVCRKRLRNHLLDQCQQSGVQYLPGMMQQLDSQQVSQAACVRLADGQVVKSRSVPVPVWPAKAVMSVHTFICLRPQRCRATCNSTTPLIRPHHHRYHGQELATGCAEGIRLCANASRSVQGLKLLGSFVRRNTQLARCSQRGMNGLHL